MRFFSNKISFLFVMVALALLFMPKINLISVSQGETAGLRIDDFILLGMGFILFLGSLVQKRSLTSLEFWLMPLLAFSLFSFASNALLVSSGKLHVSAKIFYCVRIAEYFVFFYIGNMAHKFIKVRRLLWALLLWNGTAMILQQFHLLGEFGNYGYNPHAAYRPPGFASFPSEMGFLLVMIFAYLIFGPRSLTSHHVHLLPRAFAKYLIALTPFFLFLMFAGFITLTGSRMSILALCLCFLGYLMSNISIRRPVSLLMLLLPLVGGLVLYFAIGQAENLQVRSAGLFSWNNIELIEMVWDELDGTESPIGNETVSFDNFDASWWMRMHKWGYVLKIYVTHPMTWLQGVGPGFAFAGLDGGFLRILVENGIIGCLLFWKAFSPIYRLNNGCKWVLIVFAVHMVFLDAYLAYKPMSLLFCLAGFASAEQEQSETSYGNTNLAMA